MTLRLSVGGLFRFLRLRWGVRGSLFAAFAVIAGMAIVIMPAPAWYCTTSPGPWSI